MPTSKKGNHLQRTDGTLAEPYFYSGGWLSRYLCADYKTWNRTSHEAKTTGPTERTLGLDKDGSIVLDRSGGSEDRSDGGYRRQNQMMMMSTVLLSCDTHGDVGWTCGHGMLKWLWQFPLFK